MILTINKVVIVSGTMFGSIFLFSTSLHYINAIYASHDYKNLDVNNMNRLILINGLNMVFSGTVFGYLTYIAITPF